MPKDTAYTAKVPDTNGHIPYTEDENSVWRDLVAQQDPAIARHCAWPYLEGHAALDLPKDRVPQCTEVSARLMDMTGWKVTPVPALIGFKTFFGMLADRTFPAASFIRSREDFDYIEEPDIFHEIYGHTPLLTDTRFAAFSEAIGRRASNARRRIIVGSFGFTGSPSNLVCCAKADRSRRWGLALLRHRPNWCGR